MLRLLLGGMTLLAVAGAVQLWRGRLVPDQPLRQELAWGTDGVFGEADDVSTQELLGDRSKLANLGIVACELLVMTMAAFVLVYVLAVGAVPLVAVPPLVVTYLIGAYLLGRAVYLRLGLGGSSDRVRAETAVAAQFGVDAESEFAAVTAALDSTRGGEADSATALVLTGARHGGTPAELQTIAADQTALSPDAVEETIDALTAGGLLVSEGADEPLAFTDDRLEQAEPEQVVAMATSVAA